VLFEATLEPNAFETKILSKDLGLSEAQIGDATGKQVKVAVGEPFYQNLTSEFKEKKEEIPNDVSSQLDDFDFHFVSLSCSFRPDPDCRINWARFGVELSATSKSGEPTEKRPIAWYILPKEILSQTIYQREAHFAPGIGFTLGPIKIDPKLVDISRREEFVVYEPEIFSFGLHRSGVSWDFKRTKSKEILGDKNDLFLLVRAPKHSSIMGRFLLGTEVECTIGKLLKIALAKKEDEAVKVEYPLSNLLE
jgi:hypothetical protein